MVEEMDQLGMHSSHSVANALVEFQILAREQCQAVFACGLKVASVCKNQRLRLSATLHMQMASQSSLTPLHNQQLTPFDLLNGKLVAYATAMQSVYDNWHGHSLCMEGLAAMFVSFRCPSSIGSRVTHPD